MQSTFHFSKFFFNSSSENETTTFECTKRNISYYLALCVLICKLMSSCFLLNPPTSQKLYQLASCTGFIRQTLHSKSVWSVSHRDWREICTEGGIEEVTLASHSISAGPLRLNRAACSTFFARQPLNNLRVGQITRKMR